MPAIEEDRFAECWPAEFFAEDGKGVRSPISRLRDALIIVIGEPFAFILQWQEQKIEALPLGDVNLSR